MGDKGALNRDKHDVSRLGGVIYICLKRLGKARARLEAGGVGILPAVFEVHRGCGGVGDFLVGLEALDAGYGLAEFGDVFPDEDGLVTVVLPGDEELKVRVFAEEGFEIGAALIVGGGGADDVEVFALIIDVDVLDQNGGAGNGLAGGAVGELHFKRAATGEESGGQEEEHGEVFHGNAHGKVGGWGYKVQRKGMQV